MKWRKISETEVKSTIADPDMLQDAIKERKNAFKTLGDRLVKVTYHRKGNDIVVVTAVIANYGDTILNSKQFGDTIPISDEIRSFQHIILV